MKGPNHLSLFAVLGLLLVVPTCPGVQEAQPDSPLWPEIEPFKTGHLKVSDIHEIYYEMSGNPEGIPIFELHGGPGDHSYPNTRRFFNPDFYLIVQHDQRGAGKSRPTGELRENNTWALVEDIERLRNHLSLGKVVISGGSWGSTLALAYAEKYPQHVAALVIRGIFTATKAETDYYYHGGTATFYPQVYANLIEALPDPDRRSLPRYLYELISSSPPEERFHYCRSWAVYEMSLCYLYIPEDWVDELDEYYQERDPCTMALIENYYMANGCFLEEGQLLRDAHRLAGIPTYIANGRYDVITPPKNAYELHKRIPGSKLVIVPLSGHWVYHPEYERILVELFRELEGSLRSSQ